MKALFILSLIGLTWFNDHLPTSTLEVNFKGLETYSGKLAIELMTEDGEAIKEYWIEVKEEEVSLSIPGLVKGSYALRFFHDENSNGRLDVNWIGIPSEPFGFSNNVKPRFSEPNIRQLLFDVDGPTSIEIKALRF